MQTPTHAYPAEIRPLTSLRIAAAVWVLIYHFRFHLNLGIDKLGLFEKGYLGVDLFFILSGFILSHVYMRGVEEKRFNYGSFLWARISRIYPVHLATLAFMLLLWQGALRMGVEFDPVAFDPRVLPQHLLLIHAWGTTPTVQWNFPSWSISAEWFAYLLFPAAAFASLAFRRWAWALVAAAAVLFGAMYAVTAARGAPLTEMTAQIGALRIIPAFLMGAALNRLGRSVSLPRDAAYGLAAFASAWLVVTATVHAPDYVIWIGLPALIFALAELSKTAPKTILAAAPLVYLGEVSYSVYMLHLPVDIAWFKVMERLLPNPAGPLAWAVWLGVFAAILVGSIAAYHLIERPCRNWLRARDPFARQPKAEPVHEPVI